MRNLKRHTGEKIRARREEKGFTTQGALAEKLGIDDSRVSRWETGESIPRGKNKRNLMKQLEVDESFFDFQTDQKVGTQSDIESNITLEELLAYSDILPLIKKIPKDVIKMLAKQDEKYFASLRRILELREEKKSDR